MIDNWETFPPERPIRGTYPESLQNSLDARESARRFRCLSRFSRSTYAGTSVDGLMDDVLQSA